MSYCCELDFLCNIIFRYFKCLNDILAFGFFEQCEELCAKQSKFFTKPNIAQLFKVWCEFNTLTSMLRIVHITVSFQKLLRDRRVSASSSENFLQLLQLPAFRLREYSAILKSFSNSSEEVWSMSWWKCIIYENLHVWFDFCKATKT